MHSEVTARRKTGQEFPAQVNVSSHLESGEVIFTVVLTDLTERKLASEPVIVKNILSDPDFTSWRLEASQRGYNAVIGLPLLETGQAFGALVIYAEEADAFDKEEVNLLVSLRYDHRRLVSSFRFA